MLPDSLLHETSILIASQFGLDFPQNKWHELERGIILAAHEQGVKQTTKGISEWLSGKDLTSKVLEVISTHLTVGETYFFRERPALDAFQNHIIPEIVRERQGKE